ncbi:Rieske 2Fe-2S domain-containing protein [Sulfolobus tengchongensis]|uniref:Rieske 2Fe-2S domain-containing protein n=1 Tax=Sulfolobus tengchongensis TaxID=207809 RepID=A0AAX4L224_9CREN
METLKSLVKDDGEDVWLNPSVYTDEKIFEMEMERIYHRLWVYVAHESELNNIGDFKVSRVGKYLVLITRGDDGKIRGFINKCTHRGNVLCRVYKGNSKFFKCIYHGWTFNNKGKLVGMPDREGLPKDYDINKFNLKEINIQSYKGFIFASINPIKTLEEHLGEARTFIDYVVDISPEGIEVKGPVKYAYTGNWKLVLENTVDTYHFPTLHASVAMLSMYINNRSPGTTAAAAKSKSPYNTAGYLRGGHFFFILDKENVREQLPLVTNADKLREILGKNRGEFRWRCTMHAAIMPNLLILDYDESVPTIRVINPIRPDLTHMETYIFLPKNISPEIRRKLLRAYEEFSGPVGMGSADDNEVMISVTQASRFDNPLINLTKGKYRETDHIKEVEEGGIKFEGASNALDDTYIRGFYKWWLRYMLEDYT